MNENDRAAREARRLRERYGSEASLYAALKARLAIERRDYRGCAEWRQVLCLLEGEEGTAE